MTQGEAIKCVMRDKRVSQAQLAEMCGLKNQSNVSMMLRDDKKHGIRFDLFLKVLDALEYEVVIVNINNTDQQYVVDGEYDGVFD